MWIQPQLSPQRSVRTPEKAAHALKGTGGYFQNSALTGHFHADFNIKDIVPVSTVPRLHITAKVINSIITNATTITAAINTPPCGLLHPYHYPLSCPITAVVLRA